MDAARVLYQVRDRRVFLCVLGLDSFVSHLDVTLTSSVGPILWCCFPFPDNFEHDFFVEVIMVGCSLAL